MKTITVSILTLNGDTSEKNIHYTYYNGKPVLFTNGGRITKDGYCLYLSNTGFSVGCVDIPYTAIPSLLKKLDGKEVKIKTILEKGYSKGNSSFILKSSIIEESDNFYIGKGGRSYSKKDYKPSERIKTFKDYTKLLILEDDQCKYDGRKIGKIKDIKTFLLDLQELIKN